MHTEAEPASFVGAIGMELRVEHGWMHGRAPIRPEMLAPGTHRMRVGVLATMVDLVAGTLPTGPINPTVDLRVTLLSPTPSTGAVHLVCRPVKVGSRLFVGETTLHTGDVDRPFAHSITTFMNEVIPGATGHGPPPVDMIGADSFDDLLRPRFPDERTVEMDPHPWVGNGVATSIQGGAQALLAEIAAERAVGIPGVGVVDLDIRFVNRVRSGPVAATVNVIRRAFGDFAVQTSLTDLGDSGRVVALASLLCRAQGDPTGRG